MNWKGANRLYSRQSLERWSSRLDGPWEASFETPALQRGRTLYKKGLISEISLNEDDAILTCKFGKLESYSVVEWSASQVKVRSSTSDAALGQAIAVAGLLEIEELLADEDMALLEAGVEDDGAEAEEELQGGNGFSRENEAPTRMLHLVLDTHFRGLICEAYWLNEDGSRVSALSKEDGSPRANTSEERGRLISLAARARKSHFTYSPDFGGYLLENLREVVFFIQNVWPSWKQRFSTEERENVKHIRDGVKELKVGAKARQRRSGALDVQWVFDAGRKLLEMNLADELLARGDEPMLVPELGVVKLSDESQRLLNAWRDVEADGNGEGQLYQLFSLFADAADGEIELSDELMSWREGLLKPASEAGVDFDKVGLSCLRSYQRQGVEWMSRLLANGCHCLLADEMGLGKTLQVIALLQTQRKDGETALVVCPASVVPVWIGEFAKFAPDLKVGRFGDRVKKDESEFDVLVISYALLRNRIERVIREEFSYAIIDEAQFIKNPDSKVSRSCRRIRAQRRIALTGTPIENKPLDIWPAFQFLMPGLLGSRERFEGMFAENPGSFKARLRAQIAPFMLRRTKSEVALELPEKVIVDQTCPITPRQAREYSRICEEGLARFGDDLGQALTRNRFATLSLLTRLRQVSCDPHLLPWVDAELEDSGKLMVLLEKLIEVLGTGHKVVIFSQFVRFLKRVREMIEVSFPELPIFELTGSTRDRQKPVESFQATDQTSAMLVSLKAASVGITLHAADYVFLLDPWWNPAVESQAIDRVHRIGQTKTVFVYRLIAEGTVEEKIHQLQAEKRELFDSLIAGSSQGLDLVASGVQSLQSLLALAQSNR